ncbi:MAG: hypothetical protein HYU97_00705 [Deltaproteobacteria bacterium]|nr:hypothetical protein [Deltaproteobacteria bacterium]
MFKKYILLCLMFFTSSILLTTSVFGFSIAELKGKINLLPGWTWNESGGRSNIFMMDANKAIDRVWIRGELYTTSKSAKKFLEDMRQGVLKNPGYEHQGSSLSAVETFTMREKTWYNFTMQDKNGVRQETCARNVAGQQLMVITYTAATVAYYSSYHFDFAALLYQASGF